MYYHDSANVQTSTEVYRLPATVTPQRYDIRLEPDLHNFTFKGEETVTIEIHQPVEEISNLSCVDVFEFELIGLQPPLSSRHGQDGQEP